MDATGFLPVVLLYAVALLSAAVLTRMFGAPSEAGRFATIDGLRGYLAFGVFLHHACVWYFYLDTGRWDSPPSSLYAHLGKSSVVIFFMITGFLFALKLLDGKQRGVDWLKLYVSRVMRLTPLYLLAMAALFACIFALTGGELRVPLSQLLLQLFRWLTFTATGSVDVNGLKDTYILVAGVTWSLRYEWLFYLSLPALALAMGIVPPAVCMVLALGAIGAAYAMGVPFMLVLPFAGGIIAALLTRSPSFRQIATQRTGSALAALCLLGSVLMFEHPQTWGPLILQTAAFSLIACGADLFGVLTLRVSRTFGELAYSIYLLHGLLLFTGIHFVLGREWVGGLSSTGYWLLMAGFAPVLVFGSYLTYRFVELPGMARTIDITQRLRALRQARRRKGAA